MQNLNQHHLQMHLDKQKVRRHLNLKERNMQELQQTKLKKLGLHL